MRSLYMKFALFTIGIMFLSSLFGFIIANYYYQQYLKPENDAKNTKIALNIAHFIESSDAIELENYLEHTASIGYQIMLVDEGNEQQFFGSEFRETELPEKTIHYVLEGNVYHGMREFPRATFVTGFFANELINTIGVPITVDGETKGLFIRPDIKLLFNELHFFLFWLLVLTILMSIFLVWVGTKFLIQPIKDLTVATKRLAHGDFSIRLDISRGDEIGELAQNFTKMTAQLRKLDEMKNDFIENISHDIQTPLANVKGYIEVLEKDNLSKEDKEEYTRIIQQEINRLSRLTKQLLLLASLDRQEEFLQKEAFDVAKQMKEIIFNYQWLLNEENLMVSYTLPETFIDGDPELLYNVWENLFVNAIKYNQAGGSIEVVIQDQEEQVQITFQDTGIGIPPEEKKRIFERFYRIDSSRKKVDGSGLGLAIAHSVVTLHEGFIEIDSERGVGSKLTVTLPKM